MPKFKRQQGWVTEQQLYAQYGVVFEEVTDGLRTKEQYLSAMNEVADENGLTIEFKDVRGHDTDDTASGDWEWLVSVNVPVR